MALRQKQVRSGTVLPGLVREDDWRKSRNTVSEVEGERTRRNRPTAAVVVEAFKLSPTLIAVFLPNI